jgi:hypothetical protein
MAKPATRIVQRGNGHSYLLDGEKVPGVTTILSKGIPKPWLAPWTARIVSEFVMERLSLDGEHILADELISDLRSLNQRSRYPKKLGDEFSRMTFAEVLKTVQYGERDAAANRGTQVHDLAERLARGEEIEVPDELAGHVESYLKFLSEWQPSNALLERVIVNRRWRYMGKFDMIADFPVLGRGLVDIKTSKSIYDEVGLQLCAYAEAETMISEDGQTEEPMPEVEWCGAIHVRADGYDVYRFRSDDDVFRAFLYVKQVADFFADDGPGSSLRSESLEPVTA